MVSALQHCKPTAGVDALVLSDTQIVATHSVIQTIVSHIWAVTFSITTSAFSLLSPHTAAAAAAASVAAAIAAASVPAAAADLAAGSGGRV